MWARNCTRNCNCQISARFERSIKHLKSNRFDQTVEKYGSWKIRLQNQGISYLLTNIRQNILQILWISRLTLFYPYGQYLALFYTYRLDPTLFIRHNHPSVFIARGDITGGGQWQRSTQAMTPLVIIPPVTSTLGDSLRADPRISEI